MSATASNDPGLHAKDIDDKPATAAAPPDQFDDKYLTSKWEIWAYYAWVLLSALHCAGLSY